MEELNSPENGGIVKISDEVVSVIAGIAAEEIPGVVGHIQGVTNNLTQIFKGKKSNAKTAAKSAKVTLEEDKAIIELTIAIEYGIKIKETAEKVQENVKKTVEAMTGLSVNSVNVLIQNIYLPKKEEVEEV